jgi:site-specific DNA-methyltransferase (adenine-specific)
MMGIQITNEDNMELMARYDDNHFDLAIVDPPYGIGYSKLVSTKKESDGWKKRKSSDWDNAIPSKDYFDELKRVSLNQIIWGGNYFNLPPSRCILVWDKVQRIDQADCEFAWTSFGYSARIFSYARGNESGFAPKSTDIDRRFANIHPTQKPVKLYEWLLMNYAKEGDKILDTHLGSGSIAIACHNLGFDLTACELDKEYYNEAMKRLKQHQAQQRLF